MMNASAAMTVHETKPLSLNHLAASVLQFIESRQFTTFQEVADRVGIEVSPHGQEAISERTARRRVYDVLNVFLASGLVVREGKSIRYQRLEDTDPLGAVSADESVPPALQEKARTLHEKVRTLVGYETLIRRNAGRDRPPSTIQLPAIIVGFSSSILGGCRSALDGKSLEIHASENPLFYSPMNVFQRIGFTNADHRETLRQFPALASLDSALFPRSDPS
jgi:hypothetical protein